MRAQPHLPAPAQQPGPGSAPAVHTVSHRALPCPQVARRQGPTLAGRWPSSVAPPGLWETESRGRGRKPTPREDGGRASRPPSCTHLPGAAARLGHHPLLRVASLAQGHTASPGTRCPFLGGGGEGLRPRPPWCHLGATPPKPLSGTSLARLSLGIQLGLGLNPHNLSEPPFVSL